MCHPDWYVDQGCGNFGTWKMMPVWALSFNSLGLLGLSAKHSGDCGQAGAAEHGPGRQVSKPCGLGTWLVEREQGEARAGQVRRAGRCPLPHGRWWNWSAQGKVAEVSAGWRAPPQKLLELGERGSSGSDPESDPEEPCSWRLGHQGQGLGAKRPQTLVGFLRPRPTRHPGF